MGASGTCGKLYAVPMRHAAAVILSALVAGSPSTDLAFRNTRVGDVVQNRKMPTLDGRTESLLGTRLVSVFVFVRPEHDHSLEALKQMAQLEKELARRPLRFVAVTSDSADREAVRRMIEESGVRMPVLVDVGDALYGELGVALHPVIGVTDERGRLSGYQPFRKINLLDATRGRIQVALQEISEAQLAAILDPPAAPTASGGRAHARLKLARVLLGAGQVDQAIASARAAIAIEPGLAEAHGVLADALARAGQCDESGKERAEAQRLAPAERGASFACARR